jgi:hypothetical protein
VLVVGLCGVLPVVLVLGWGGNWLWQRRQAFFEALSAPPESKKPKPAASPLPAEETLEEPGQSIHPALVAAMKHNNDNYKAVSRALTAYLSDILKTPVNGLTRAELNSRLRAGGVDETLVRRIEACFYQSELGRFGPATDDVGWSLMVEADDVLFNLDRVFGGPEKA